MIVGQLVGILGAGGAVGAELAAVVSELGLPVRLGARSRDALASAGQRCTGPAELVRLEAGDPEALTGFCSGCGVVVNCAVTDAALRAKVAATALAGGAHYLDPGGDEAFRARLACAAGLTARAAVLAAGAQPGLTALVPRWLAAQDLEPPFSLTVYTVTMDWMTRGAAAEFLLSLGDGQPGALTPLPGLSLPFLSGELVGHPHLSGEAERLARCLSLTAIRCYHVFEVGGRLPAVLTRLQQDVRQGADPDSLTAELIRAAEIEMFGRRPFQQLVFQLDGRVAGQPASRVAVLRAAGTYQLTASVAAAAVVALLRGQIPAGCHFVADVLDPVVVGALPGRRGETSLHLSDRALAGSAQFEQGRL